MNLPKESLPHFDLTHFLSARVIPLASFTHPSNPLITAIKLVVFPNAALSYDIHYLKPSHPSLLQDRNQHF